MGPRDPLRNDGSRKRPGFCGAGLGPNSVAISGDVTAIMRREVCDGLRPCDHSKIREWAFQSVLIGP